MTRSGWHRLGPIGWRVGSRASRLRWWGIDRLAGARRTNIAPTVALTFDDGPQPGTTDRVLDLLAEHRVAATFFCVGRNALDHPDLLHRIRQQGHAIGSHSFSHPDPERTPIDVLAADYRRGRAAVSEALGDEVTLFRPPRGFLDPARALQLRRLRLAPWLWSVDPSDWHPDTRRGDIVTVAGRADAGDVVLMHDWIEQPWNPSVLDRAETLAALPEVIRLIRARGLEFGTLPSRRRAGSEPATGR